MFAPPCCLISAPTCGPTRAEPAPQPEVVTFDGKQLLLDLLAVLTFPYLFEPQFAKIANVCENLERSSQAIQGTSCFVHSIVHSIAQSIFTVLITVLFTVLFTVSFTVLFTVLLQYCSQYWSQNCSQYCSVLFTVLFTVLFVCENLERSSQAIQGTSCFITFAGTGFLTALQAWGATGN